MGIYDSVRGKLEISSKSDENMSSTTSYISSVRREGGILQSSDLRSFSYEELRMATRNFHRDNLLGEGGFGPVFKGHIGKSSIITSNSGTDMVVAVKILNQNGFQGHSEWLAEVNYLGHFDHPHIIKLIGSCLEDEHRCLVYEFMPRGSLDHRLFSHSSNLQPLSWNIRMKIALGVAKALAFLHSTEINVLHRGFHTSDILLDSEYNAKLSGFGLAIDGPTGDESYVETSVMGVWGYVAPEYVATGYLSAKCDVYGFGVVLLEMLCGQKVIDRSRAYGEQNLKDRARSCLGTKQNLKDRARSCLGTKLTILRIIDKSLESIPIDEAYIVAALVLRCLSTKAGLRPNMDEIVAVLDQLQESVPLEIICEKGADLQLS